MEFHPARMRLFDGKFQRIIEGIRRCALCSCQPIRPGVNGRAVESIAFSPNLEDDGIDACGLEAVENGCQLRLLISNGQAG